MADSATTIQTQSSPLTGPSSFGSAFDAQGLPTVHEVSHHKVSYDFPNPAGHRPVIRPSGSRDASLNSSLGRSYKEKEFEAIRQQGPYTTPGAVSNHVHLRSDAPHGKLRKGDRRNTMAVDTYAEPTLAKKPKRGGLRNTIRRMFGRSPKDRISMPAPTVYQQRSPKEFVTSATDVQGERSASVLTDVILRSSGLSSHPPSQPPSAPYKPPDPPALPTPEQCVPEPPQRPRRASVPSDTLNKDDMQAVTDAISGLSLQTGQESNVDARAIGFAVTNGSNPKRRSRSVGAFREADHRMSPIQWRHYRTRSDEIHYLRGSTDVGTFETKTTESPEQEKDNVGNKGDEGNELAAHTADFNFGLSANEMQGQERMGLEERLITLEIKLMDFEYALSRLQTGSISPSRRMSQYDESKPQGYDFSNHSSEAPPLPNDASPVLTQTFSRSSSRKYSAGSAVLRPKDRPTSVATTLKPGHNPRSNSFGKPPSEFGTGSSFSGLTIEHYTTLVTLIRHEQSARLRLEEQVSQLQKKLDCLQPPYNPRFLDSSSSQHSHTFSISSSNRRHGIIQTDSRRGRHVYGNARPRSSSYSTNETDTDDENYHDAYVTPDITPIERGEYERGAFERVEGIEDGAAF
ncbi:MAG: hypothetical protein Q9217_006940 [Psora testacea]